jgi:threonine aldolase
VAAAGLYALDHNVERLAEDHENARALADGLAELEGVELDPDAVETNIVVFGVPDPADFCARIEREGVRMSPIGPGRVRAVTHLDVDREGIEKAVDAARAVLGSGRSVTAQ